MQEMWVRTMGWEDSPGGGNDSPLQYSCLENPVDKGTWQAPWGHKESDMTEPWSMGSLEWSGLIQLFGNIPEIICIF